MTVGKAIKPRPIFFAVRVAFLYLG